MTLTREEREAGRIHRQAKNRERKEAKAKRPKNMKASRGREIDHGFLAFLRRQPCCVGPVGCAGHIEAAHVRFGRPGERPTGMQRKPSDAGNTVPLCVAHHRRGRDAQHDSGERKWWEARRMDPHQISESLYKIYLGEGGDGAI